MKDKFLSKAYGGVTEARRKLYGLGLPRQWKVITSTLLLLFTFAIGNVWGDETINLYYGTSKAVDGNNLNTEDFFFSGHTSNTGKSAVEIGGTSFTHYLTMSGYGASAINSDPAKLILYYPKKSTTTFTVYVQNKYNGNKKYYIDHLFEGETVVSDRKYQKQLAKDGTEKHEYTFTNTDKKNAVIALMPSQTMYIYQITVTESGDDLKQAGDNGYSFNTYRAGALAEAEVNVDGLSIKPSSKLNVGASYFKIRQSSTYAKFTLSQKTLVTVGVYNSRKFIFCAAATPTPAEIADKKGTGSAGNVQTALAAGTWYLESESTSELQISNISFSIPTISYDANGGEGSMSSNTWTVAANGFTAPSGKKFDGWKDADNNVYTVGQEVLEDVTLYAQWKDDVAEYTVTYKDGGTTLKSVNVAVGSAPDAYSPTKDLYTFAAWQKDAADYDPADLASDAATNDEITLTARWTAQYTSGTYEFTGHLTMGTAPNQMVIENNSDGQDYTAGRIDNIYVSAQKIGYEATGDYGGWKLKTTSGTLRFMVENACGVRVTLGEANPLRIAYTEGGVAKTADIAKSTTSSVYKADANTLVTLTNITSGNKTVTLKKIEILPLYNVNYVDETGDGEDGGNPENVTEVTLPTPSETTVGSYSFTGWVADQTVKETKVGGVEKTAGAVLTAGETYQLYATTTFTAQWQLISDFDVKFFQGYGDPDVQIGTTQSISTGGHAVAPADPERAGFAFLGWSTDGTEANIKDVATFSISTATNFTAMWKQVWTVTFDGAGNVIVEDGEAVASPNSPVMAGKVFQGWYNAEVKYDFSAAVIGNLALTSKWTDADANHYVYAYNDDFHYDGVVYKTPEGKVDAGNGNQTLNLTTPYTLFSGTEGITSIVMTDGIYDSKAGAIQAVTSHLKVNNNATSKLTITIKAGYTATLKIKAAGYSASRTMNVSDATPASLATPTDAKIVTSNAMTLGTLEWQTFALASGSHDLTVTGGTLYISELDVEAEALPTFTVTYKAGEGTGDDVEGTDATEVADVPGSFTAPEGKVFNGWKDESSNDVEVGAAVTTDMTLTAQWINHYAVTFNMNGHGDAIDPQDIKEGAKATRPDDPIAVGFDFGGWFTDDGTFEAPFDFNTPITATTPLYAKWTADPCPDKKSIVKAVMATNTTATVTGYNSNEYAGGFIINNLADDASNTNMYDFGEGEVKGFKLKGSNSAIFATLSKGGFEVGDQVVFAVTKNAGDNKLAIYAAKDKDNVLKLVELDVDAAGIYTYRLTQDNIDAIEAAGSDYLSIGTFRGDYNPYIYSVELKGCRSFAEMHTLTFKNFDGTATIAAEPLEEGTYASTVAPAAPKITLKRFLGWAEAIDGTPVELTSYTITEDKTLYAVYEDIVCPAKGKVYSLAFDAAATAGEGVEYTVNKNNDDVQIPAAIAAISGGEAYFGTTANADVTILVKDGETEFRRNNSNNYIRLVVECPLQVGDTIAFTSSTTRELNFMKGSVSATSVTSSSQKIIITDTEHALYGAEVIYIKGGNAACTVKTINITRPAIYDVTFDMMGHGGSAPAVIEDVLDGHKIEAPSPAPTDADYRFGGWYKENTLANEWDFDNDVVTDNITLYAKWVDKSDATLKSLKYGTTEIALEAGVYTYAVNLSPLATSVPALTAVPSNPNATAVVTDAAALDGEGHATSTVLVTPEEGGSPQTYTVNFTKLNIYTELADVTETTSWDWNGVATDEVKINDVAVRGLILANYIDAPNFEKLEGQENARAYRSTTYPAYQGTYLRFHATKPGRLTMNVRNSSDSPKLYVNGGEVATLSGTRTNYNVIVPAGDVIITSTDGDMRIYNMTYKLLEELTPDYTRPMTEGRYGTICLPNGGIMVGATLYEVAYYGATSEKIFFDEILNGEMVAGVPYIYLPNEGADKLAVFYTDEANESAKSANGLVGYIGASENTSDALPVPHNDGNYILNNNQYREVVSANSAYILSHRAYIHLAGITPSEPALAPGRRRISMSVYSEQVATGIENTGFESETPRKVLINGELFIIRGEKMYDAKGQLVK